jgi:hypothetical protein
MARSKANPLAVVTQTEVDVIRLKDPRLLFSPAFREPQIDVNYQGAIVRLQPPIDATDEDIARVTRAWAQRGVARVIVLPRPKAALVPEKAAREAPAQAYGAREAVLSLVAESNSRDRDALQRLCEKIMGEAGL